MTSVLRGEVAEHNSAELGERFCPTCGKSNAKLSVCAAIAAENLPTNAIADHWRGFFHEPCFFTYYRCTNCEQLFAPHYLTRETLAKLYASMPDNIHSGDEDLSYRTQEKYAQRLSKYSKSAEEYLEIGPDAGHFARALQKTRRIKRAFLIEPNQSVWSRLSAEFPKATAKMAVEMNELEGVIADNSLDVAVAVHVLDHLLEPSQTLDWMLRKLKPGGVVTFVVHNEASLLARLLGQRWPAYCMQHPQLYNPATLTRFLRNKELENISVRSTANYFPVGYLLEHAVYAATRQKINCKRLSWPVCLKLGNIQVTAVKRFQ